MRDTWGPPATGWPSFDGEGKRLNPCTGTGRICEPKRDRDECAKCGRSGIDAANERSA